MFKKIKVIFEKVVDLKSFEIKKYKIIEMDIVEYAKLPQIYTSNKNSFWLGSDGYLRGKALANNSKLGNYYKINETITIEEKEELEKIFVKGGNVLTKMMKNIGNLKESWKGTETFTY